MKKCHRPIKIKKTYMDSTIHLTKVFVNCNQHQSDKTRLKNCTFWDQKIQRQIFLLKIRSFQDLQHAKHFKFFEIPLNTAR